MMGTVQGLTCVTQGKICPVGKEDSMTAVEEAFVLLTKNGNYYFLPNLDRAPLARHINDLVRLTVDLSPDHKAIRVTQIDYFMKTKWQKTWDIDWEEAIKKDFRDSDR